MYEVRSDNGINPRDEYTQMQGGQLEYKRME